MRDTTAKKAVKGHPDPYAGRVKPWTPPECRDCEAELVPGRAEDVPDGCARHGGRGYCCLCYYRRRRAGNQWTGPAPTNFKQRWKAADLVAEWEFLRIHQGLNREQAAERLHVKPSTLTTAACRVKQYAKRDALRAEIAAAETEAHRINDDMIAYVARKAVAA